MVTQTSNPEPTYRWVARGLTIAALGLAGSLLVGDHGLPQVLSLRAELADQASSAMDKIQRNEQMHASVQGILHNDRILEDEARARLGLVRPDEIVYVLQSRQSRQSRQ